MPTYPSAEEVARVAAMQKEIDALSADMQAREHAGRLAAMRLETAIDDVHQRMRRLARTNEDPEANRSGVRTCMRKAIHELAAGTPHEETVAAILELERHVQQT